MTQGDDGFDYLPGLLKYPKGSTPCPSRATPGAFRSNLRSGDGSRFSGAAEFVPQSDARGLSPVERQIIDSAVNLLFRLAIDAAAPHLKKWWTGSTLRAVLANKEPAAPKIMRAKEAENTVAEDEPVTVVEAEPVPASSEAAVPAETGATMSSAEAQQRVVAAVRARIFSDDQLRRVPAARIEDAGGPTELPTLDQAALEEIGGQITLMLDENPSLPADLVQRCMVP